MAQLGRYTCNEYNIDLWQWRLKPSGAPTLNFRRMHIFSVGSLGLVGSMVIASVGATAPATTEAAPSLRADVIDLEQLDSTVLSSMTNELQMSIDPADGQLAILPDDRCVEQPFGCPYRTQCPWLVYGGAWCFVTSCGTGACPICPAIFPNLIVKSWCAYGCMRGTEYVGGAFLIQSRFGWHGPVCIPP